MDAATPKLYPIQSTTVQLVKTGNCRLDSGVLYNSGNAVAYLQCFDAKQIADVTLGTTAPKLSIAVAAGASLPFNDVKMAFLLGLCIAATAGPATNVAPNAPMLVNLGIR